VGVRRLGLRFQPAWEWRHPDVREFLRLTLPLMVGLTMTFSTEFFFRFFGSYLPAGSIAVLNFSLRVMLILVGIFGQAVGTASYPFMARLAAENRMDELNRLLNRTLRYLALVIPFSALLMVLSPEVVRILFQRGRFDPAATRITAEVLVWFLAGAFAFAAYTVVVRGYFATRDTLFPAVFGTVAVLASLPLYPLGIALMGLKAWRSPSHSPASCRSPPCFASGTDAAATPGRARFTVFISRWAVEPGHGAAFGGYAQPDAGSGGRLQPARQPGRRWSGGAAFAALMLLAGYGLKIAEITDLIRGPCEPQNKALPAIRGETNAAERGCSGAWE